MNGDVLFDGGMFHLAYAKLLREIRDAGVEELNSRTGSMIKTLPGAVSFKLDLRDGKLPICGHRKLFPKSAAAEVAWSLMGTKDVTWLAKYTPMWNKFTESDGRTIDAAYGHRWTTHFKRNQLDDALFALSTNPSDRRVYIGTWDPGADGLGRPGQKNVPCPVGFTLSIVGGELHSSILLRSSDVFVGLPYDVMAHAILLRVLVDTLNWVKCPVALGSMHFTLAHPHLYQAHYEMTDMALDKSHTFTTMVMPDGWDLPRVKNSPDEFVSLYSLLSRTVEWPALNLRPEVII